MFCSHGQQPHSVFTWHLPYRVCSSDEREQGATHGQQDQAAVQVQHRRRRSADAQPQLGNTHTQGKLHFKTSSSVSIVINAEAKSFLKVFFTWQTNRTLDSGSTATVHRSKLQKCCCFFFWKVNVGQTQKTDMCVLHKNPVDTIFDEVLRCYISSMRVQHTSQTDFTSRRMKACRRTGCTSGSTTLSTSWQPVWALLGPSLLIIPKKLDNQCEMKVRVCGGGGLNLYTKKVGVETFSLSAVLLLTTSTSPSLNIAAASVNSLLVWPMSYLIL